MNKPLLLLCFPLLLSGATAAAQSDSIVVSGSDIELMSASQAEAELATLEKRYEDINLRAPRAWLGVSSALLVGGTFSMGLGMAYNRSCLFTTETLCRDPFGTGLAAFGGVALVSGIVGIVVASVRLKKKKREQSLLRWQIGQLKQETRTDATGP